jgi:hypothetical protein
MLSASRHGTSRANRDPVSFPSCSNALVAPAGSPVRSAIMPRSHST